MGSCSRIAALTVAAVAALTLAGGAGANVVEGGKTTFDLDRDTAEGLADMGIGLDATGQASFHGGRATFPVTGGDIDPNAGHQGIVGHAGGLIFFRMDGAAVKFKKPALIIDNGRVKLAASARGDYLKLAKLKRFDLSGSDRTLQLKDARAKLSKAGAKVLRETFDFPFRRGLLLGTVATRATIGEPAEE